MKIDAERQRRRVAVAVSGGGRSLANMLGKEERDRGYEVACVIASREDCGGVEIARRHGLPVFVGDFRAAALVTTGAKLYAWLETQSVHWIALAGFIKLFPIQDNWHQRIINIHPALLPNFGGSGMYGDRVHKAVLAVGASETGATVHFVDERYDEGDAIASIRVKVLADDTPHSLADRVFAAECQLYPYVLDALIDGRLPLVGGQIEKHVYETS